jgi:hypothetical protein
MESKRPLSRIIIGVANSFLESAQDMDGSAEKRSQRHDRWGLCSTILWTAHFSSPPLTKWLLVRFLLGEPKNSHSEFLSPCRLTERRHLLAEMGCMAGTWATLCHGTSLADSLKAGLDPVFRTRTSQTLKSRGDFWLTAAACGLSLRIS